MLSKGKFYDLRKTAICDWLVHGMMEYDVMRLAGYAKFEITHKYYLTLRDDLIDGKLLAMARSLCKELVQFDTLPISGAKEIDRAKKK